MRLDFFLPFLRRPNKTWQPKPPGLFRRVIRKIMPAAWLSDSLGAKPGWVRRLLKKIGPTWHSAPARRAIQAACFVLFCVFFFWYCWPYSAEPGATTALPDGTLVLSHHAADR